MTRHADQQETVPATGLAETPGDYGFSPGTTVGRYVLGERLGAGGMGVVYSAHDARLDRSVALKLLRPDASGDGEAHRQLLREAQTLARLAHPNVVNVHDIGDFEGRVYVDMELVKGSTLAQWLAATRRTWEEVVGVFVQAGRGLAAAHAIGIVHRDFKPDNVLVGDDGRVRVADFGIALLGPRPAREGAGRADEAGADEQATTASPVVRSHSGSIARTGTPAYMAPEQRRDGTADTRSDQYSYCVALYEAVYGERPRAKAPSGGPARGTPPAWLKQAIERGLSLAPEDRHSTMEALLDMLVSEPRRRRQRRRGVATAAAAVALLAAGGVWGRAHDRAAPPQLCKGAEAKLAGVWDEGRKAAVERTFLAIPRPFSADAWRGARATLDAYTREWAGTRTDACEATRVRGEQSDQILDLRMACLDDRLAAVGALVDVFSHADDAIVTHAFGATQALPRLAACSDAKWLTARVRPPADPETAAKVTLVRARLAQVKALDDSGKYADALSLAQKISGEAEQTGDRGVQATALYTEGCLLGRTGNLPRAEETLRRATSAADAAGDDAIRVRAWGSLLFYVAGEGGKPDLIPTLREQAQGALARLGGDDDVEANFLEDLGSAFMAGGKIAEAREADERAAGLEERTFGKNSWQEAVALINLGITYAAAGEGAKAIEIEQRALAIDEHQLGRAHPFLAAIENTLAGASLEDGNLAEAEVHARRAVEIAEGVMSEEELTRFLYDLGEVLLAEGKLEAALESDQRALAIATKSHASDDPVLRGFLVGVGETYVDLHRPEAAIAYLTKAVALPSDGDESGAARAQFDLARALYDSGSDARRARALAVEAKAMLDKSGAGPDDAKRLAAIDAWLGAKRPAPSR
jgi:tetratricopeptide (TPR) repeat protein